MIKSEVLFSCCTAPYSKAQLVLFGAPYDAPGCIRPGAGLGPAAVRHASLQTDSYSFYQNRDLGDCAICDAGDAQVCGVGEDAMLASVEQEVRSLLSDGKIPVMLGGHPAVTLGSIRALSQRYPRLNLVQFGACTALRDGEGSRSSQTVMRRCYELLGEEKIHQFCVRSGTREEFQFATRHTQIHPLGFEWLQPSVDAIRQNRVPVYLSLNFDCLDPSLFPAVENPVANGVSFKSLLEAIRRVSRGWVVGADVVGLIPALDHGGACAQTAAQIIRELLLSLSRI